MNKNLQNFKAFNIAKDSYRSCLDLKLPRHLKEQLLRAASSAAINLAEGSARRTHADKRKFYNISMASIREAQSILALADLEGCEAELLLNKVAACVYKLLQTFEHG